MRFVLATNHLGLGGSESYILTIAEQLQRLGHEASVFSPDMGKGAAVARERGVPLCTQDDLPAEFDAALVQDAGVSYELGELRPSSPQLFVAHSESLDLQSPPQFGDWVRLVVALNDRVAARMRSLASAPQVARLRQPVDTERFAPRAPLPVRARRALLLSNTPHDDRLEMIEEACARAGLELLRMGGAEGETSDPREAIHGVEIVIGYGRSILEGMACGRAAYVYDWNGGDGWVTPESYARIEADGIAARNGATTIDARRLASDLTEYSPAMGPVNHDLVIGRHRANVHAQELVELARGLGAPVRTNTDAPLLEMARLVRLEWRARADVRGLLVANNTLQKALTEAGEHARAAVEAAAEEATVRTAESCEATLSWRLTAPLRFLAQWFRRFRRR